MGRAKLAIDECQTVGARAWIMPFDRVLVNTVRVYVRMPLMYPNGAPQ